MRSAGDRYLLLLLLVVIMLCSVGCPGGISTFTPSTVTVEPGEPVPPYDAAQMIVTFADQHLGLTINKVQARGVSGKVSLPATVRADLDIVITIAGPVAAGSIFTAGRASGLAEAALGSGSIPLPTAKKPTTSPVLATSGHPICRTMAHWPGNLPTASPVLGDSDGNSIGT